MLLYNFATQICVAFYLCNSLLMNKKACFVVPFVMREKDNKYVELFIKSAVEYDMLDTLYFLIDNTETFEFLTTMTEKYTSQKPNLIIIPNADYHLFGNRANIPTIKKFYGLNLLKDNFDYIAAIDCECLFLKHFDTYEIFDEIWRTKSSFFRNRCRSHNEIFLRNISYCIGLENNEKLIKETDDFSYSNWFNDIPVYKSDTLDDFFDWMFNNKASNGTTIYKNIKQNFCCFDYWVYWFWLIVYRDLHDTGCTETMSFNSLIESVGDSFLDIQYLYKVLSKNRSDTNNELLKIQTRKITQKELSIELLVGTHWTTRDYESTKEFAPNDRLCMQFHVDRLPELTDRSTFNYELHW